MCDSENVSGPAFDLSSTFVHLGLGSMAIPLDDFEWTAEFLSRYEADHAADGDEGRLVLVAASEADWSFWERHPAGDEVVFLISGRVTVIQEIGGSERSVSLSPGEATINPRGSWHTTAVHEPGKVLFVTPGRGTEHRPR
jgi:mannose-6-phosphate isomerase-like protein (cupin superfamily)